MNHKNEIPLRSVKRLLRRLRIADKRHCRNMLLSSVCSNDSIDVE